MSSVERSGSVSVPSFFFNPMSENHPDWVKVSAVVTLVALAVLTFGIYIGIYYCCKFSDEERPAQISSPSILSDLPPRGKASSKQTSSIANKAIKKSPENNSPPQVKAPSKERAAVPAKAIKKSPENNSSPQVKAPSKERAAVPKAIKKSPENNSSLQVKAPSKKTTQLASMPIKKSSPLEKPKGDEPSLIARIAIAFSKKEMSPEERLADLAEKNGEQCELFTEWAIKGDWNRFHKSHYDWWAFPIDRESAGHGKRYTIKADEIEKFIQDNPNFITQLRNNATFVVLSWGWDLINNTAAEEPSKGQEWDNHQVRLGKIAVSLRMFKQWDLLKSLGDFVTDKVTLSPYEKTWIEKALYDPPMKKPD